MFVRKARQLCCHFQVNNAANLLCYWTKFSICKVSYRIKSSKPITRRIKSYKDTLEKQSNNGERGEGGQKA